ncbi:aminotransferase class I/II-fold pyridoxal phosphate-dependent enzyme [Caballeronia sp. dw_19]|uniref:aminotransferase class I/II-fold pyridoxal phosphate-dependent enzyme n=1 Tax=Caballeronia sp. dw_19 TaxID=2719791 RepID=UPI001BD45CB3|nr:aminotransferase class I/II-fold pyridoxal phosphate-dependent enzyme [Caballeronia sp. dw_19]
MSMTYDDFRKLGIKIDMTRGKPSPEQLDLSSDALANALKAGEFTSRDGIDCRNYGHALGLPEAREFGADLLGVAVEQVVAAGNSSLELMHDAMAFAILHGMADGKPWRNAGDVAFLCPVPGYDRHFAICAALGVRMIPVPLTGDGPDMDFVEAQVAADPAIKGMWCVPLYSNPTGEIYSVDTIRRLASMQTAASDFRLFWDDAYRFHHLTEHKHTTLNMIEACAAAGHPDRALVFASLSKITVAGAGLAFVASSRRNIDWWQRCSAIRTIGPDKLNQLRHVRFLRDRQTLEGLMERHRALLRPKFDAMTTAFSEILADLPGVSWTVPQGGYFISLYSPDGLAKRTVALAAGAGIAMTPAGAAFPHGLDPRDRHLRVAPTFPALDEVKRAAQGIALSLRRAFEERG